MQYLQNVPLAFCFLFFYSLLLPILLPLLTWNPPWRDRIRPPRTQVARTLNSPFPSLAHIPSHPNPAPPGFTRSKFTFIRTMSRIWLTRSSTSIMHCSQFLGRNRAVWNFIFELFYIKVFILKALRMRNENISLRKKIKSLIRESTVVVQMELT
jgi:hypothetical protein